MAQWCLSTKPHCARNDQGNGFREGVRGLSEGGVRGLFAGEREPDRHKQPESSLMYQITRTGKLEPRNAANATVRADGQ